MLPMLPAFWLGGMVMALEVLSVGATLVYPGSPEIGVVLAAIERFQVNRINGWGDMLPTLRHAAIARGIDVDAIVGLGLFRDQSGELIPPHLQANLLGMSSAEHTSELQSLMRISYAVFCSKKTITSIVHLDHTCVLKLSVHESQRSHYLTTTEITYD